MKVNRWGRWTTQLYWPEVFTGPSAIGIKLSTTFIFRRYNADVIAAAFELLGFGIGVMRHPKEQSND